MRLIRITAARKITMIKAIIMFMPSKILRTCRHVGQNHGGNREGAWSREIASNLRATKAHRARMLLRRLHGKAGAAQVCIGSSVSFAIAFESRAASWERS